MPIGNHELAKRSAIKQAGKESIEDSRRRNARLAWIAFSTVLVITIVVKIVYLMTAESTVDAEEIPLASVDLVSGGAGTFDIESTRLYGFNYITSAISLFLFGFRVIALKLPGLAFFLVSIIFLFLLCRRVFEDRQWYYQVLPVALIALGPPVAQMWALKNRGGFIETWALLAVLLWLYDFWRNTDHPKHLIIGIGFLMGLAIWAQPIAACFALPLGCALLFELSRDGWRGGFSSFAWLAAAGLAGVLPLLAINFLHDMKSFAYVAGGEDSSYFSGFSAFQRAQAIFDMGIPCLLGLKQQWYPQWVLPRLLSWALYLVLVLPLLTGVFSAVRRAWHGKAATVAVACAAVVVTVMAANLATSFGSFQMEPRRLLLLYVPCSILITIGLFHSRRWLLLYLACFATVSIASNADYLKTNWDGFKHPVYDNYQDLTATLEKHDITGVYSGIMIGAKVSFESHGSIQTFWQPYRYGPYGYVSDGDFDQNNAVLFPSYEPSAKAQRARFMADLDELGLRCHELKIHNIDVFLACNREFNIRVLPSQASQVRAFAKQRVIFSSAAYSGRTFDGLYHEEASFTWTRPRARIPFFVNAEHASGVLTLDIAQYRPIAIDDLAISVDGKPVVPQIVKNPDGTYLITSEHAMNLAHGFHELDIETNAFLPSDSGGNDPRALGIPLRWAALRSN